MRHQPGLSALAPWVAAFGVMPDARIATPDGEKAASDLRVGDLVRTRDDGDQALVAVHQAVAAPAERNHFPVRIKQGALGFGLPRQDLCLGPQHRVLFQHIRVPLLFGEEAVLVRAKSLAASHDRVMVENSVVPAQFVQLTLQKQGVIYANGIPIESVTPEGDCDLEFLTLRAWELMAAVA